MEEKLKFSNCKCFTSEEKYDLIGHAIAVSMEYYRIRFSESSLTSEEKKELTLQRENIIKLNDKLRNTPICHDT